jgi:hypothetical protein
MDMATVIGPPLLFELGLPLDEHALAPSTVAAATRAALPRNAVLIWGLR